MYYKRGNKALKISSQSFKTNKNIEGVSVNYSWSYKLERNIEPIFYYGKVECRFLDWLPINLPFDKLYRIPREEYPLKLKWAYDASREDVESLADSGKNFESYLLEFTRYRVIEGFAFNYSSKIIEQDSEQSFLNKMEVDITTQIQDSLEYLFNTPLVKVDPQVRIGRDYIIIDTKPKNYHPPVTSYEPTIFDIHLEAIMKLLKERLPHYFEFCYNREDLFDLETLCNKMLQIPEEPNKNIDMIINKDQEIKQTLKKILNKKTQIKGEIKEKEKLIKSLNSDINDLLFRAKDLGLDVTLENLDQVKSRSELNTLVKLNNLLTILHTLFKTSKWGVLEKDRVIDRCIKSLSHLIGEQWIKDTIEELIKEGTLHEPKPNMLEYKKSHRNENNSWKDVDKHMIDSDPEKIKECENNRIGDLPYTNEELAEIFKEINEEKDKIRIKKKDHNNTQY